MRGTVIQGFRPDNPAEHADTVGIKTGSNYNYAPVFINPRFEGNIGTEVSRASSDDRVPVIRGNTDGLDVLHIGDRGRNETAIQGNGNIKTGGDGASRVLCGSIGDRSGELRVITKGGGSDLLRFWDSANSQPILSAWEGGRVKVPNGGPADAGVIEFANSRIYEDKNGEIVAENSSGDTTQIT